MLNLTALVVHLAFAHLVFTTCGQPVLELFALDFNFMWPTIPTPSSSCWLIRSPASSTEPKLTVLYRGSVQWQLDDGSLAGKGGGGGGGFRYGILWSIYFVIPQCFWH